MVNGQKEEMFGVLKQCSMIQILEGQRPLLDSIITVAQVLKKKNGYKKMEWLRLGAPNTTSIPNKKGFDFFYGYNCQRQAHTYYPTHLWKNEKRHILNNFIVTKQEGLGNLDPLSDISYKKYNQQDYAPTLMHNEALSFITKNKNSPFFYIMLHQYLTYLCKLLKNGSIITEKSLVRKNLTQESLITQIRHLKPLMLL